MNQGKAQDPLVSVVMIVRDGAPTIGEAIESVLAQDFGSYELLVIDDHSTDETDRIVADFSARSDRIRWLPCEGEGIVDARNTAIAAMAGTYMAVLDSDDLAMPSRLRLQVDRLETHPSLVLVGSHAIEFGEGRAERELPTVGTSDAEIVRALQTTPPFAHSTIMARANAVREVGGYRKQVQHAEDFDLYLRLAELGDVGAVYEPLVRYRVHDQQMSVHKRATQMVCAAAALESAHCRRSGLTDPIEDGVEAEVLAGRLLERLARSSGPVDSQALKLARRTAHGLSGHGVFAPRARSHLRRVAVKGVFGKAGLRAAHLWLRSFWI